MGVYFKISKEHSPKFNKELMKKVPYIFVVGNLMYAMVCIILDIAYTVRFVNRFMYDP